MESLAPAAVAGLLKSWQRGNATGALEVLKALGFLNAPPAVGSTRDRDIDAEIAELLRLARDEADPA